MLRQDKNSTAICKSDSKCDFPTESKNLCKAVYPHLSAASNGAPASMRNIASSLYSFSEAALFSRRRQRCSGVWHFGVVVSKRASRK